MCHVHVSNGGNGIARAQNTANMFRSAIGYRGHDVINRRAFKFSLENFQAINMKIKGYIHQYLKSQCFLQRGWHGFFDSYK